MAATNKPLRVLLADDNADLRTMLGMTLSRLGIEATLCSDGAEAWEAYSNQGPFDAVVLDYQMPRMDGLQCARLIRESEATSGKEPVPLAFVSAWYEDLIENGARSVATLGIFQKPDSLTTFVSALGALAKT